MGSKNKLDEYVNSIFKPPKDLREKEAATKNWNSLALGCLFFSFTALLGIVTWIVTFFAHPEERNRAISRTSSNIFTILVLLVFNFSLVLFCTTQTSPYSDRLIKIANIVKVLLLLLLTLVVATVAQIVGVLLPFVFTLVATGDAVGMIFIATPN